jgi:hypothetical protein
VEGQRTKKLTDQDCSCPPGRTSGGVACRRDTIRLKHHLIRTEQSLAQTGYEPGTYGPWVLTWFGIWNAKRHPQGCRSGNGGGSETRTSGYGSS